MLFNCLSIYEHLNYGQLLGDEKNTAVTKPNHFTCIWLLSKEIMV